MKNDFIFMMIKILLIVYSWGQSYKKIPKHAFSHISNTLSYVPSARKKKRFTKTKIPSPFFLTVDTLEDMVKGAFYAKYTN
jgi:hypothetical protein